jgi:hypothetical protein
MALFLPQRWKRQPQGPVQIDWSHPLASSLTAAVTPIRLQEMVSGRPLTLSAPLSVGKQGVAFEFIDAAPRSVDYNVASAATPPQFTVAAVAINRVSSGGRTFVWCSFKDAPTGTMILCYEAGGGRLELVRGGVITLSGGSNVPTNTPTVIGARWGDATSVQILLNGRVNTTHAHNATTSAFSANRQIGRRGGFNASNALISGVFEWNRALSNSEWASFSENPWQIFAPLRQTFFSLPGTTGPVLSLPTVIDITSTSVRPRVTITI